jgi:FkbH-like protein
VKLTEALQTLHEAESQSPEGTAFPVLLACGFTALHLETFLGAHLQKSLRGRRVKVGSGLYGDLAGTLERQPSKDTQAVAIALEWPDLDARLGYRSLGGWGPAEEAEIAHHVAVALERLGDAIERLSDAVPVAVSLPSLPLPPAFHAPGWEAGKAELAIRADLARFAARLAKRLGVSVVSPQRLLEQSPFGQRLDLRAELLTGHPYSVPHADAVGAALTRLLLPAAPKKGLITDLDDTVWSGLVGEVGPEAVAWDLDNHAQVHGLYQQTLAALAGQGVLLAVASKNNPDIVNRVFARRDVVLDKDKIFPMEVDWRPKSESVGRILAAWNVGADSVLFIDDCPMELAEVKAAWPEIDCLLFPKNDYAAILALLRTVRDLFGKRRLADEDGFRLASIRAAATHPQDDVSGSQQDMFLSQAGAVLTAQFNPPVTDLRILELVNKTNQFNLNGLRHTEAEWRRNFNSRSSFLLLVSYKDKYGPLGKIAVLAGKRQDSALWVHTWVMSCRAFSRRIEHSCLDLLFSQFGVGELRFNFAPTPRNGPFRACFAPFLGVAPEKPFSVTQAQFEEHCPRLYHKVETIS